ncbi:MAG: sugar ABC transporter ATP-binding protein [Spirochaetales bacterium]|jgi:methyl-galactoside transport system ATP-binding protein|nr:sugar ABC transporter ATP-binding protein [Spirochaetales bacterium]
MDSEYAIEMLGITKQFPGVLALNNVDLRVKPGSVHALMGENGAGKSTLMKCLFGIYKENAGKILLFGKECHFTGSGDALRAGVSMIQQELANCPERTVAQNLWMGREPMTKLHFIDHKKMHDDTIKVLKNVDLDISPETRMGSISISKQQSCEIARAVSYNAKVVVMDEPTSSLTEDEVNHLFKIIRQLRDSGIAVIYISHKMDEIFQIADTVSVMRDGEMIGTYPITDLTKDKLISLMVGRDSKERFPDIGPMPKTNVTLKVSHLTSSVDRSFTDICFELHKGEILGIGGLVGAQRTELVESIFGIRPVKDGEVFVNGKKIGKLEPSVLIKNGVGLITEDRRRTGLFPMMSITNNTSVPSLGQYLNKMHLLDHRKIGTDTVKYNKDLNTKTPTMETLIQNLSGGNQQKVIIARWLMTLPDILIMDEPTRGIDVGAKHEIYMIMNALAKQGKSIIMVSSEMPELIGMSHRIMVLCEGRETGILNRDQMTQENVLTLAASFMK